MHKRKYDEISNTKPKPLGLTDKAVRLQRQQLEGLLDQGKKVLFHSLKVARGFERQKLGRRQKTAKLEHKDADITRLETEVAALKSLDLATTAELHLYKSLLKIKTIAIAPAFPQHVQETVEASRKQLDAASANVQARLFKSTSAQEAIAGSLRGIRDLLGIAEAKIGTKKRVRAKDYANELAKNETRATSTPENTIVRQASQDTDEWDGDYDSESGSRMHKLAASDGDEESYEMYASRLAASSDEDSTSGYSDSEILQQKDLDANDITEDDDLGEDSEEDGPESRQKAPKRPPAFTPSKSTTFLPSLSMGGYWSGSESAEDLSDMEPQERRNRRGQQARRALWEKKFGKNANHLKTQPENRDQGWDTRRGAIGLDDRGKRGRGRGRGGSSGGNGSRTSRDHPGSGRGPISSGANSDPVALKKTKPVATDGPLHPSWEAAKKAKEQKRVVAFQGKKVVFD